mgnify:FL=1
MTGKIFKSIFFAVGIVLLASFVVIMGCLYQYYASVQDEQLQDELTLASAAVETGKTQTLEKIKSDRYRITWVDTDGTVIYDTQTGTQNLENHADREEIRQAFENGEGVSTRYSATFTEKTMYRAKRLSDGTVLRVSVSMATVGNLALGVLPAILFVFFAALILSVWLANRLAKHIVEPINNLDLDHPTENDTYEELSPLLVRIHQQYNRISEQLNLLKRKTDEFTQITDNLNEGLILLGDKEQILSINPAAKRLFGMDEDCVGKDFLTVDRSYEVSEALKEAAKNGQATLRVERGGRVYRFDMNRIESDSQPIGTAILTFDITEQEFAERNRREFTANVSHELKTPLQGIIGSAELIENGMAKPEDVPRFVGHIRKEASRLVTLIEDIIRLSQLDEGVELPLSPVNLTEVSEEAAADLSDAAKAKNVHISVQGKPLFVNGVRRLLYEIVYNLCDNAVKYNVDGGEVFVTVDDDEKEVILTVRDTGIGIAPEHQTRIFERFYRVDKSHSKASGGTGLGLSIVKHAVMYHHGSIDVQSEPNHGTTITVRFPK